MDRKKVCAFALAASICLNVVLVVFGMLQKASADTAKEEARKQEVMLQEQLKINSLEKSRAAEVQEMKLRVEAALLECQLELSKRK